MLGCLLFDLSVFAQVQLNTSTKKVGDKKYEIHLMLTIEGGWHIYSCKQPADAIGLPTTVHFTKSPLWSFEGAILEIGRSVKRRDPILDVESLIYSEKLELVQVMVLKPKVKTIVSGTITYMACTDEKCLPPETVRFSLPLH